MQTAGPGDSNSTVFCSLRGSRETGREAEGEKGEKKEGGGGGADGCRAG